MVLPLLQNYVFKPKFTHRRWEQVQIGNADTYQHPLRQTCSPLLSLSQALTSPRACAAGSVQRKTWETLNLTEFNWAKKWFRNQGAPQTTAGSERLQCHCVAEDSRTEKGVRHRRQTAGGYSSHVAYWNRVWRADHLWLVQEQVILCPHIQLDYRSLCMEKPTG